jgi:hypothetical protein
MTKTKLEELIKDGYAQTGATFSYMQILKRDNERILYNTRNDTIYMRYKVEYKDGKLKNIYSVFQK